MKVKVGKKGKAKELLEPLKEDGSSSFARALGSVDFHTRDKGLEALAVFLQKSTRLTPLEFLKLWKGLFYCFWHSDKAPVQKQLAERLAAILSALQTEVGLQYFQGFLETMKREWFGIDRLRLDKFMLLVRTFIRQMLVLLEDYTWDEVLLARYLESVKEVLVKSSDAFAQGLALQIADVTVPELLQLLESSEAQPPKRALEQIMAMFLDCMVESQSQVLSGRVRDNVFEAILEECKAETVMSSLQHLDLEEWSNRLFQAGAQKDVKAATRELLYNVSRRYETAQSTAPTDSIASESCPRKRKKLDSNTQEPQTNPALQDGDSTHHTNLLNKQSKKAKGTKVEARTTNGGLSASTSKPGIEMVRRDQPSKLDKKGKQAGSEFSSFEAEKERIVKQNVVKSQPTSSEDATPATASLKKKKKVAKDLTGLREEEVETAAQRALAAIEAHKEGKTTVHPATPGSPKTDDFDLLFSKALEEEEHHTPKLDSNAGTETPAAGHKQAKVANGSIAKSNRAPQKGMDWQLANSAHLTPSKHVKISLKKNVYLDAKPSPDVRTPLSCRPKGSALKRVSKFPGVGVDGRIGGSPRASPKSASKANFQKKNRRQSFLGRQRFRKSL